jgi:GNAT superfamily N-acetyltransferase
MTLEIRKVRRKDLSVLVELLAGMEGEAPALAHVSRVFREMASYPSYAAYLAHMNGRPVGTFSLLVFPTLVREYAFEALADAVVVAPAWRGRGIGGAMMAEAMRLAAQAGCYKLMLSSSTAREDAHSFYRSLGFRQHGVSFWIDIAPLGDPYKALTRELAAIPD